MLHLQGFTLLISLALTFMLADRIAGGGIFPKDKRPISADAVAFILAAFAITLIDLRLVWIPIAWFIWRNPKWKIGDHGGIAPQTSKDALFLLLRHQLATVTMVFSALIYNGFEPTLPFRILEVAMFTFLWTLVATLLGIFNGLQVKGGKDSNAMVELLRGLTFGIMLFCVTKFA